MFPGNLLAVFTNLLHAGRAIEADRAPGYPGPMPRRRVAALALAALLSLGLVACSAPAGDTSDAPAISADEPGDAGQSAADACGIVRGSIESATEAFSSATADDPASVVDALRTAAEELAAVSSQVTNDEVAALLPPLQEMFLTASDAMDAVASGDIARLAEIGELAGDLQASVTRFQELCAG